jgi:lipid-A-disaccharide synthase-like uncharacterized protein
MGTVIVSWFTVEHIWALVGLGAQTLFASRFIIQWYKSELEGRSVIPVSFWYVSLFGGLVMTAYAVHLGSAALILGQTTGLIVYGRNLRLIWRERALLRAAAASEGPVP